ncbi:MAG: LemA family protein [Acidimicrobiales bacterium]
MLAELGVLALTTLQRNYNRQVEVKEQAAKAWSLIDVSLQRRAELIPALVAVVEGYGAHEREVQELVAELRTVPAPPAGHAELPDDHRCGSSRPTAPAGGGGSRRARRGLPRPARQRGLPRPAAPLRRRRGGGGLGPALLQRRHRGAPHPARPVPRQLFARFVQVPSWKLFEADEADRYVPPVAVAPRLRLLELVQPAAVDAPDGPDGPPSPPAPPRRPAARRRARAWWRLAVPPRPWTSATPATCRSRSAATAGRRCRRCGRPARRRAGGLHHRRRLGEGEAISQPPRRDAPGVPTARSWPGLAEVRESAVVVTEGPDHEAAVSAIRRKYGIQFRLVELGGRLGAPGGLLEAAGRGRRDHPALIGATLVSAGRGRRAPAPPTP